MAYDSGVEYLLHKLDEQRSRLMDSLRSGKLDHPEYKRICGSLDGIEFAKNLIIDLQKRLIDDKEELTDD